MATDLKQLLGELGSRFASVKYKDDPGLLKHRVKDQGKDLYYWLHSFQNLFVDSNPPDTRDDLLFYVKYDSKNKKEKLEAQRRDARNLPDHSDSSVLWDQTLYLNLLLHEFEYHLTCCVLKRKEGNETLVDRLRTQVSMQVYPSTTERRMDKKGRSSEDSYPSLMFYIDNYEQIFKQVLLHHPGEKVAVQIVAINRALSLKRLIFTGALDYTVLKDAVKQKEKENASFTISLLSRKKSYTEFLDDFFFIQMKGPNEKGHAQMAVRLTTVPEESSELKETNGSAKLTESSQDQELTRQSSSNSNSSTSFDVVDIIKPQENHTSSVNSNGNGGCTTLVTSGGSSHLLPPIDPVRTSPSAESVNSTHSGDLLCPSTDEQSSNEKNEEDKGSKKSRRNSKNRVSLKKKSNSKNEEEYVVHSFLTFIELPWYTIAEDILQGSREPLFI